MSVTDVLEVTSVTSSPSVSQSSEPITDTVTQPMAGATDATVTSVPTVLHSNKPITDVTVKKLLDTAPAKVNRMIWLILNDLLNICYYGN